MAHRVCPFFVGYLLVIPFRRLWHNPEKILAPFVTAGMTVLDIGSAMGFFTLPLATMVGAHGKVVAVDVQEKMLRALRKRAQRAKLSERTITRVCGPTSLGLTEFDGTIDFALAFAVVHEAPDVRAIFADIFRALRPGGSCLVAEPKGHVSVREFEKSIAVAEEAGLRVAGKPDVARCHAALLVKG